VSERPALIVTRRPLHFFIVADCSGSMAADGKMPALNNAIREALPHLRSVADQNPHAELLVRAIAFSTGARWHLESPTPVDQVTWNDLEAGGYTDLGAALTLLADQLRVPPMQERALPPAIVLVSDGLPTDEYETGLARLLDEPWGARSVRMAVGIGRHVDYDVLEQFIGAPDIKPVTANNPEQLVRLLRWASTHAGRSASQSIVDATLMPSDLFDQPISETVW
jgi:uncharacterized protein YegL